MRLRTLLAVSILALTVPSSAAAKDLVLRPSQPTNRLVVFIHGSGGSIRNITEHRPTGRTDIEILLHRGFAVAASDADGPQTWGSRASVADYKHLIDRLDYERVFLLGGSMGGLATMQLIGEVHPEAVALGSPVCNISAVPLLQAAVEVQWGKARPAYLSPVKADPEPGLPVKIWASPEDTWVPKARNADLCARELRRRGASVEEIATAGNHDNHHMIAPNTTPNFFSEVAQRNKLRDY